MARSVLALVACLFMLVAPCPEAQVRSPSEPPQGSDETHAPARFDIDEQPLATALRAFSEQGGVAVLFDDALVADRRSPGVHGVVSPRDALRILLVGTGLHARFSSVNAFTVTADETLPAGVEAGASAPVAADRAALDDVDATLIQDAVERALCAHAATRPGEFRLAMQLWIDVSGAIAEVTALAPSANPGRDAQVLATVRSVKLPPRLARFSPVTLLLTPSRLPTNVCRGARAVEG